MACVECGGAHGDDDVPATSRDSRSAAPRDQIGTQRRCADYRCGNVRHVSAGRPQGVRGARGASALASFPRCVPSYPSNGNLSG